MNKRVEKQLPIRIRKSLALVILRVVVVDLALWRLWAFGLGPLQNLFADELPNVVILIGAVWSLLIFLFGVVFTVYSLLWWRSNYYIMDEEQVTHFKGVLWHRREAVRFPTLDKFEFRQSLPGRVLNYGSISLLSTETGESMELGNIGKPSEYLEIIKSVMPEAEKF